MEAIAGWAFIAAGILVAVGAGAMLWSIYGPRPRPSVQPVVYRSAEQRPTTFTQPTALPPTAAPRPTATALPNPWAFGRIDFGQPEPVLMIFDLRVGEGLIETAVVDLIPHVWTPELFGSDLFNARRPEDHGVVWQDDEGRVGLWLHSGPGEASYDLQELLERDQRGYFRSYREIQPLFDRYLIGSQVSLYQGDRQQPAYVAAATRVGPQDVGALQPHVTDMAEYLGLQNDMPTSQPALMLYFCGRLLNGEGPWRIPDESPWQQARFVIGLVPALSQP